MIQLMPMPLAGPENGKLTKIARTVLAPFAQKVKSEILDPVEQKTGGLVFHVPPAEIQAAMQPVCGSGPNVTGDIGTFLAVTGCWLDEAFGMWTAFEQIGMQSKGIGDALNKAVAQVQQQGGGNIPAVAAANVSAATQARALAAKYAVLSAGMIEMAQRQKKALRGLRRLDPDIRDTIILFNDGIDSGELSLKDPSIIQLKSELEAMIAGWRRLIVQQIDLALLGQKHAIKVAEINQKLIEVQFNLAAMVPGLFALADEMLKQIAELIELLDFVSMPGRAFAGLAELPGMVVGGVARALTEPATEAFAKTALIVVAVGSVAVVGAILLKKYGVIGKLKGD